MTTLTLKIEAGNTDAMPALIDAMKQIAAAAADAGCRPSILVDGQPIGADGALTGLYRVDITERQQTDWLNGLTIGYEWMIYESVSYAGEWERGIYRGPLALNGEALCITVIESTAAEAKAVAVTYVRAMKRVTERAMRATTQDLRAVLRAGLMP